jgi:Bacterial PH domain
MPKATSTLSMIDGPSSPMRAPFTRRGCRPFAPGPAVARACDRGTVEMNMNKIESVDVDQTLLGRLFNYGNVTIRGIGSSFEPLRLIDAPLKLRTTVTAG